MGVSPTPPMTVKMRAVAIGMAALVLRDYGQQTHLASEHPAADPDDEDPGANREVRLDPLRNKPSGTERRQSRDQDNPARVRQRDKDPEDHGVHGTAAHANDIRSRDRLPMPRGRRMDRAQPKAGQKIKDAFSHSLAPREQGGKAS